MHKGQREIGKVTSNSRWEQKQSPKTNRTNQIIGNIFWLRLSCQCYTITGLEFKVEIVFPKSEKQRRFLFTYARCSPYQLFKMFTFLRPYGQNEYISSLNWESVVLLFLYEGATQTHTLIEQWCGWKTNGTPKNCFTTAVQVNQTDKTFIVGHKKNRHTRSLSIHMLCYV